MLFTRYSVASRLASGKRVLELGAGSGLGFGLLSASARFLVGADYSDALLSACRIQYRDRIPLVRLDAHALPFADNSFELILLFEASYYLTSLTTVVAEVRRVLMSGGRFLIVSANPERPDFIPSPYSVKYHSSAEFRSELAKSGMRVVAVHGAFPLSSGNRTMNPVVRYVLPQIRRLLNSLGLVPRTLRGRARLKRLFYPRQRLLPPEIPPDYARVAPLYDLPNEISSAFKVLYVTAEK
jgi:ubiquinone/menaquinone biosynthesis C-methylase UbiE